MMEHLKTVIKLKIGDAIYKIPCNISLVEDDKIVIIIKQGQSGVSLETMRLILEEGEH